ncbi:MAG: type II toxin-antitoxin system mRNA interferase toxin, RelE/StbE family [Candidatus Yonathbacteria bacterium]|nr:type II toxin-antitoxin system mRNA interferase toxin, RelE/StbE family [Candidatus Yonathbacteria bacterium]
MEIYYSPNFARQYKKLSQEVKLVAEKRERVFRKDWKDPILATHKLKGKFAGFWAFSIDNRHRIIFDLVDEKTVHFHTIGDHGIYK